jgi:GT2 family glycosyltransferase
MNVAAVIPVRNGREDLRRLLASLARQTIPIAQIIAVDNGSTDGAPKIARQRGARVISMGRNTGFAAAVNRGIREGLALETKPDWVAALNSDVELAPDYLEKLAATNAWFATGKLIARAHSDNPVSMIDGTFDALCRGGTAWRVGSGRADGPLFSKPRSIVCAPWTAAAFRASLFERVGLLDERFESYLEDVDFGLRCASQGVEGVYEPSAVAWHKGSATLGRWHPETVRRIARNQVYLLASHYPRSLLFSWLRAIVAAQLLWGGVSVRHGAFRSWARGVAQGLTGVRSIRKAAAPMDHKLLRTLLTAQEQIIRDVQAQTGYDSYWRWYFRLAGGEA